MIRKLNNKHFGLYVFIESSLLIGRVELLSLVNVEQFVHATYSVMDDFHVIFYVYGKHLYNCNKNLFPGTSV